MVQYICRSDNNTLVNSCLFVLVILWVALYRIKVNEDYVAHLGCRNHIYKRFGRDRNDNATPLKFPAQCESLFR